MRTRTLLQLCLCALVAALALRVVPASGQDVTAEPDATAEATPTPAAPDTTELYQHVALTVPVDAARYANPFDPDDIEVIGVFESPSGEQIVIPGFWMQPYADACTADCRSENLQVAGDPVWQVRFTPTEVGAWSYVLQVRDNGSVVSTDEGDLTVTASTRRGFIRTAPNRRYFQYDNGAPYFVIGHNLNWSWSGGGGLYAYERWLDSLSKAGGNYARIIIDVPWFIGLEWDAAGDYTNAQDDAARLDAILTLAEDYGVALQVVVLWHQALRTYSGPPVLVPESPARPDASADWDDNPYNSANGGLLGSPNQFFTDERAQELFRRRLRYISARWGYSPNVFAWELIDEVDQTDNYNADLADAWVQDMASYLRQIDQQRHLITAGSRDPQALTARNPLLDFTQARYFQRLPIEETAEQETSILSLLRANLRLAPTPALLTSHSLNPWFEPTANDPEGIHVQNGLWTAALSGAGGGAVSAWGETYIIPQELERYYAPLAAFTAGVDFGRLDLQPAEAGVLTDDASNYGAVRVSQFNRRFRAPSTEAVTRTISGDGIFPALDDQTSYLYGQVYNNQLHQTQTYHVAPPVDTYLEVAVRAVSDQLFARLAVTIDGVSAAELLIAQNTRAAAVRVPIAAGAHTVVLENIGEDWLELEYIEVGQLVAPARALTLRDASAGIALAWLQHRGYTWDQAAEGVEREPLTLRYWLDGMPPGRYLVELWNPLTGAVLGEEVLRVRDDGVLVVDLLPMTRQTALRAFLQPEPSSTVPAATPAAVPEATPDLTAEATPDVTESATEAVTESVPLAVTNTPRAATD